LVQAREIAALRAELAALRANPAIVDRVVAAPGAVVSREVARAAFEGVEPPQPGDVKPVMRKDREAIDEADSKETLSRFVAVCLARDVSQQAAEVEAMNLLRCGKWSLARRAVAYLVIREAQGKVKESPIGLVKAAIAGAWKLDSVCDAPWERIDAHVEALASPKVQPHGPTLSAPTKAQLLSDTERAFFARFEGEAPGGD
jgi:hypothetical protein